MLIEVVHGLYLEKYTSMLREETISFLYIIVYGEHVVVYQPHSDPVT